MAQILVQHLTFAYEGSYDNIFDDVSFQIDTDWKLGFTGRNGRGKTTFLRLLQGRYPYRGHISSPVEFEYFPFSVADQTDTAFAAAEAISPDCPQWKLARELNLLEVPEDVLWQPFETLSQGEQTKLLLAALFIRENRFLLIDEPTNHLDMKGRETVSRYLNRKKGFILVSHDRAFLDGCIDHILAINKNDIEVQQGNFSSWMMNKEWKDRFELAENEKLKGEIGRLRASAREKSVWSDRVEKGKHRVEGDPPPDKGYVGHKSAKMMKRSKILEKRQAQAIEEKSKLLKNIERVDSLKIAQIPFHSQRLLTLENISISYGERDICEHIGFSVESGDRVALYGRNGSGKSSILKLICGEPVPFQGKLGKSGSLEISYVSQDSSFLQGTLSDYAEQHGIDESLFKAILRKLDFSRVQFEKDMRIFSAGQKKKVLIARSLCEKAHLLVWDEPLNYIDVISRMQIEQLLLECRPTMLFVEHDRVFCEKIASKLIQL